MSAQPLEIINERLRGIDGRLLALDQKIDSRFDALDKKMDSRFDALDKKLTTMMFWSLGTSAALTAAIVGVILTHH